ncbi:MAG TPA: hypothetical protein VLI07_07415 [Candidatus Binatus sp.]|jgi:hypothetical protein|nr:hypothetical protein [Candidatus Binatus sp.]
MGLPASDLEGMVPPGTTVQRSEPGVGRVVRDDAVARYHADAAARESRLESSDRRSSPSFEKLSDALDVNAARIRRALHELHVRRGRRRVGG